jgi:hypothetical protein
MQPALERNNLDKLFAKFWPDLQRDATAVMDKHQASRRSAPTRPQQEILEEVLVRVRTIEGLAQRDEDRRHIEMELLKIFAAKAVAQAELSRKTLWDALLSVRPGLAGETIDSEVEDTKKAADLLGPGPGS